MSTPASPDLYALLGIPRDASQGDVDRAFRSLSRRHQLDSSPDASVHRAFMRLTEAYRVLSSPTLRAAYDRELIMSSAPPGHASAAPTPAATPPLLTLRVTPGQASLRPLRDVTRFYALAELAPGGSSGVPAPLPLDLTLLIDRSSSMRGAKLHYAKQAVRRLLSKLQADDLLTVIFFGDRPDLLLDGVGPGGLGAVEEALGEVHARGGTEMAPALELALDRMRTREAGSRFASVVLLTDGQTYGDEQRCLALAARARQHGLPLTTLGLGTDWNRDLLDQLAATSGGGCNFVEEPVQLPQVFDESMRRLRATLATGVKLTLTPAPGVRVGRATRVSPDIAEAFGGIAGQASEEAVTVELGALVARDDGAGSAVLWEMELHPSLTPTLQNVFLLGRLTARYAARPVGHVVETAASVPLNSTLEDAPIEPDVRLALELITAYRLQTQADTLRLQGLHGEAAERMRTASLRLRSAGSEELAAQAEEAARSLLTGDVQSATETLRAKYGTKNREVFQRLRRLHLQR